MCNAVRMSTTQERPRFLTVPELAAYLRVSRTHAYRLVKEGRVPTLRVGGSWRIPVDELERRIVDEPEPAA